MPNLAVLGNGVYSGALQRALESAYPRMQERLRAEARSLGWEEELVQALHLTTASNGSLVVTVPDDIADRVWDEEYGDTDRVPKPAVRRFASNTDWHAFVIEAAIQEAGL